MTVLRRAIGQKQPPPESIGDKYVEYSEILASQGRMQQILDYNLNKREFVVFGSNSIQQLSESFDYLTE